MTSLLKKTAALLAAGALAFSLTACTDDSSNTDNNSSNNTNNSTDNNGTDDNNQTKNVTLPTLEEFTTKMTSSPVGGAQLKAFDMEATKKLIEIGKQGTESMEVNPPECKELLQNAIYESTTPDVLDKMAMVSSLDLTNPDPTAKNVTVAYDINKLKTADEYWKTSQESATKCGKFDMTLLGITVSATSTTTELNDYDDIGARALIQVSTVTLPDVQKELTGEAGTGPTEQKSYNGVLLFPEGEVISAQAGSEEETKALMDEIVEKLDLR